MPSVESLKTFTVDAEPVTLFNGEELHLKIAPGRNTGEFNARLRAYYNSLAGLGTGDDADAKMGDIARLEVPTAEVIEQMVVEWDMTEGGVMLPVTAQNVYDYIPAQDHSKIRDAIFGALQPKNAESGEGAS